MMFIMGTLVAVMVFISHVYYTNGDNVTAVAGQVNNLTSQNYPLNYYNNTDLQWMIHSTSDFLVKVTILNATMEPCCDYVQIFDGLSLSSPSLVKFYSMPNQTVYYSSGQDMYIRFYRESYTESSGFTLTYEAIPPSGMCGVPQASLSAVPGEVAYLTSPGYPSNYYNNADCGQLIIAPDDFVVKVIVTDVSLDLNFDYIEMFDGGLSPSSLSLVKLYSMPIQTVYYSSEEDMYISFYSDESITSKGFRLTYEAIPSFGMCGVIQADLSAVLGEEGYLTSPSYPSDYYNNADCGQLIIAPDGFAVKVDVTDVSLELNCDFIEMFDGLSPSSPSLVKLYSMQNQTVYYSSGQDMYIRFHSDVSVTSSGFSLTYEAITFALLDICSVIPTYFADASGELAYLTSPSYPSNYDNNADCSQLIIAPVGFVVKVIVMDVSLELYCDYVQMLDGLSRSSPLLVMLYSMPSQTVYYSSGQDLYIRFHSDRSVTSSGFKLAFQAVPASDATPTSTAGQPTVPTTATTTASTAGLIPTATIESPTVCSVDAPTLGAVPGQVGHVTSPYYPSPYYNNADCRWLINAGSGYVVKVTVTDVSLETGWDFLELYDGSRVFNASLIIKTSSMPAQTVFYSSGQYMYIRFHSDNSKTTSGFRLTYEAVDQQTVSTSVCPVNGTALSALPGQVDYLRFPNHPSNYSSNTDCRWVINSASGDVVKVTVVNASSDNFFYHIQIFDGMSESSATLVTFYGMPLQTVYYSSGQYMYIRYTGYGSVTNSGLRVTYEAVNQPSVPTPSFISSVPRSECANDSTANIRPLHLYFFLCLYLFTSMISSSTTDHI